MSESNFKFLMYSIILMFFLFSSTCNNVRYRKCISGCQKYWIHDVREICRKFSPRCAGFFKFWYNPLSSTPLKIMIGTLLLSKSWEDFQKIKKLRLQFLKKNCKKVCKKVCKKKVAILFFSQVFFSVHRLHGLLDGL